MKISLSDLRDLAKSGIESEGRPSRDGCPSPENLVLCVRSRLPKKERARIIDHVAVCRDCAQEVKSLLEISAAEAALTGDLAEAGAAQKSKTSRAFGLPTGRPAWLIASAALAAVFLAAVAILSISRFSPRAVQPRGAAAGLDLVSPVEKASAGSGLKFVWKARPDSKFYVVEIFDASLSLLWRSGDVSGNEIAAPEDLTRLLKPGETYLWMVTAVLEDEVMVRSKLGQFETEE